MGLFDEVASGRVENLLTNDSSLFTESAEDEQDEVITEAVYPESLKELTVIQRKVNLPRGTAAGKGVLVFLYTPTFGESVKLINNTTNLVNGNRYYYYYYPMMYRGRIYNKTYRVRNFNLRKDLYEEIRRKTNLKPYLAQSIGEETRNMYYDLFTYVNIFNQYSAKMMIKSRVHAYWAYMKPLLNGFKQYRKLVAVNIDNYPLESKVVKNLTNPLYMLYFTFWKFPDLLKDVNVEFLFFSNNRILKINPSKLNRETDFVNFKIQMGKLMRNVPKEALDEKIIETETLASEIASDTKTKLGMDKKEEIKSIEEDDVTEVEPVKEEPSEEETEVEKRALASAEKVVQVARTDNEGNILQAAKVKEVAQMDMDSGLDEERKILERAYQKNKMEKVPTSPRSTARDQLLLKEQQNLKLGGMTVSQLEKLNVNEVKIPPRDVSKVVETPNENMKRMSFYSRNKTYIEKVMPKDIMNVLLSLNTKSIPLYIRDINVEETSDELNYKETYTVHLEDAKRQRHTLKFDIPKVLDDRFLYLGGGKKNIKNQSYFFPVVKTKEGEVQLVSNYNKMYIRRIDTKSISSVERLKRYLKQNNDLTAKYFKYGNAHGVNKTGEFITTVEYDELAKFLKRFQCGDLVIYFNQYDIQRIMENKGVQPDPAKLCIGTKNNELIYVDTTGTQKTKDGKSICDLIVEVLPEGLRDTFYRVRAPKRLMYAEVTVMKQHITIAMLLGFWEGIESLLRKAKVQYHLEDHMPKTVKASENVIRFADTFLVYEDTMEAGVLLNGIRIVNTEQWKLTDFNTKEPYMEYFVKVYGKASIANALMNFYEWFIDPVTKEILEDLDLPTNIMDLVIYAAQLLADSQCTSQLNQRISRIRSFEIIPMVLYGALADQYVLYRNANGKKKFTIPRDIVIKNLLAIQTVEDVSTLNPSLEMDITHGVSFKGFHGINLDDAYTIGLRSYDKSMTGIIGPSSPPDGGTGLNKTLSVDPQLSGIRGFPKVAESDKDVKNLKDVNLFSPVEMTMPDAMYVDDCTRAGLITALAGTLINLFNCLGYLYSLE